jgi:Cupin-like domain
MERATITQPDLLDIDHEEFARAFARRSVLVDHALGDHPLLSIEAIAELADRLPARSVRREAGNLAIGTSRGYAEVGHGRPSQSILDVEEHRHRISLRDVQQIPAYRALVEDCLGEVAPLVEGREGGMSRKTGYIFISCSNSTTPMHFDAEHSFLLQIRGTKHVSVAAFEDRPRVLERELDRYVDGRECDFPAMQAASTRFTIERGTGVYLPSYIPHWVETEGGVSISFSIPWYTEFCHRAEGVYRVNSWLRRGHLRPRRPGASHGADVVKSATFQSLLRARDATRKLRG